MPLKSDLTGMYASLDVRHLAGSLLASPEPVHRKHRASGPLRRHDEWAKAMRQP